MTMGNAYDDLLDFWFEALSPEQWFQPSDDFDRVISTRFGALHRAAAQCEWYEWRVTAEGRLAEVMVLDQFSRHIYRGQAKAFACDPLALALAQTAVDCGADKELPVDRRVFLYLPYMHSESLAIHSVAVSLFNTPGMEQALNFEWRHQEVIQRFGRYPHRNAALGRESTLEEIEFLKTPGSSF